MGLFLAHLTGFGVAGALALTALLAGFIVLRRVRERWGLPGEPSLALSLALGWGILSHAGWAIAACATVMERPLFNATTVWVMLAVLVFLGRRSTAVLLAQIRLRYAPPWRPLTPSRTGFSLLMVILLCAALFQPLVWSLSPSFLYDILEYHRPAVSHLLTTGSLAPIAHNAYTHMPQGCEMLYALAGAMEGRSDGAAPGMVNLMLCLTTTILLVVAAQKLRVGTALRGAGALVFLCHPIAIVLLADIYVGMATACFVLAAQIAWLRAMRLPNRLDPCLTGVFLGLALACKYPVAGIALAPMLLFAVPLLPKEAAPRLLDRSGAIRITGMIAWTGIFAAFAYAPWAARALCYDGTLFPPLTDYGIGVAPSATQVALRDFMQKMHAVGSPLESRYWRDLWGRLSVPGMLLFVGMAFHLLNPRSDRRRRALALMSLGGYAVWALVPHAQTRFLIPLLPGMIVLTLAMFADLAQMLPSLGRWAAVPFYAWALMLVAASFAPVLDATNPARHALRYVTGQINRPDFVTAQLGTLTGGLFAAINADVPEQQQRVLLLYEARAAAITPKARVTCNTVFDSAPLWRILNRWPEMPAAELTAKLREAGVSHLLVNEVELARLLATYPPPEALKDETFRAAVEKAQKKPGNFDPSLVRFAQYYPPYYYDAPQGDVDAMLARVQHFLGYIRSNYPLVVDMQVPPARAWVARISEQHGP